MTEELKEVIHSRIKCNTVKKRLAKDLSNGYEDSFVSYNKETGEFVKNINDIELKFKINVNNNYERAYQIGSFIRTIVALLTKINPNKILIIIDMSTYNDRKSINIRRIIDQLIYVSTSSVILVNVFMILPDIVLNNKLYLKQKNQKLLANGVNIISSIELLKLLDNYTPYNISLNNGKVYSNLFNNFNSSKNYISLEYNENVFANTCAPIIHQLASYHMSFLKSDKKRLFIICIEKISNIHRIYQLISDYNIDNIIVCLPESTNDNYDGIIKLCNEYKIKYYDINNIINIINESNYSLSQEHIRSTKSNYKNVIAVDIHKDAINFDYNKRIEELNDSILIFGYELIGIPKPIKDLCKIYLQIESRKSVNVVAALSIILSSVYN